MKEFFGKGEIRRLREIIVQEKPKKIAVVTGTSRYAEEILEKKLKQSLEGYTWIRFAGFKETPKIEDVKRGVELIKREGCDFVIGVGGGVVLDIAKAIALLSQQQNEEVEGYIQKTEKVTKKSVRKVLIPTTAGTGSEATHFSVVYIGSEKYSLAHPWMLAEYVIIDPELTYTLPKYVAACTGFDAFAQAIEAFWSVNTTQESQEYSANAIRLVMESITEAVNAGALKAKEKMCKASNLAGKAINIAKTTAPHAVSYPITYHFKVPHGHAVALTLPSFFVFNASVDERSVQDPRGVAYVKATIEKLGVLLKAKTPEQGKEKITNLMVAIGLKTRLSECGIKKEAISLIIKEGFNPERIKNNPRQVTESILQEILERII